jgi:hypothetical protein
MRHCAAERLLRKRGQMKRLPPLIASVLVLFGHPFAMADAVKDREGAVRGDRAAMEKDARWIYNDWQKGFAEAKRQNKPLLIVLRCVPCLACMGIDAQVLLQESDVAPLLDKFVCVRVINANALDLTRFQFDYDLSFSAMVFNGDGTVYGRYGSWTHQKNAQEKSTAGLKETLQAALAIHGGYPANKESLAGKQGGPAPFKTPVEIPGLAGKYERELNWEGKVVQSCVHCHQIGDAFRTSIWEQKKPVPAEWIFPHPGPECIGLEMDPNRAVKVTSVAKDSPAAKAGLEAGDEINSLAGQPLMSVADLSWALHRAPDTAALAMTVKRAGAPKEMTLELSGPWRQKSDISRRTGTWGMRGMVTGGLLLEELPAAEREALKLSAGALALRAKHVGQYGKHAAAKNAGFLANDIIVEIDGSAARATEAEVIGRLLTTHRIGESVKAVVIRGDKRLTFTLPMQ